LTPTSKIYNYNIYAFFHKQVLYDIVVNCSLEVLHKEASKIQLHKNPLVIQLLNKIKHAHSDDRIKYITIFRGQVCVNYQHC